MCSNVRLLSTLDFTFLLANQWVIREKQWALTLSVHLVHPFKWSPSCLFTFVALYILFWLFYLLCGSVSHDWSLSMDYILLLESWFP